MEINNPFYVVLVPKFSRIPMTEGVNFGGNFDWGLKPLSPDQKLKPTQVNLMRLWTLQMVYQMVHDRAYVNEISDEPKFHLTEEEIDTFDRIFNKMSHILSKRIMDSEDQLFLKRKIKTFTINDNN